MKKLTLLILLVFTSLALGQQFDGYKFCIDPGHGGHDGANDRYIPIADFWESEGNFSKALYLEDILTGLGADVILTRYGNDDSDDIALSARAAIANSNNVDYFHSIHSNGLNGNSGINRTLMLFRGYTDAPVFPEGEIHEDEFFGQQEIYRGNFVIALPYTRASTAETLDLGLRLQGCADIGLCYPPQR